MSCKAFNSKITNEKSCYNDTVKPVVYDHHNSQYLK